MSSKQIQNLNLMLFAAAWEGHMEAVSGLLSAGADWSKRTRDGRTALDIATTNGYRDIVLLLEQAAQ